MPGPFVQVAALCESVIEDTTGVLSLIRIVDRLTHTQVGHDVPDQMPPLPVNLSLVVTLKSGDARGRHSLVIRPEAPSGERLPEMSAPVLLEGEDRGVNFVGQLGLQLDQEGLYWFDILLNGDQMLTRVPLRLVYQPQRLSSG